MTVSRRPNIFGDDWEGGRDRPGWHGSCSDVAEEARRARRSARALYELAPGQKTFPYHWHQLEEEWLIVLRRRADAARPGR